MELILKILFPILFIWSIWKMIQIDKSYKFKLLKIKGNSGEDVVARKLDKLDSSYIVKNDVRLSKTQIDHIVIKGNMIFVIETKRWSGKIIGKRNDDKWKQVLRGEKHWYKNPIKQNEYHIDKLKEKYIGYKMINVVVFVNNENVPKLKNVIGQDELYNFIMEYDK